MKLANRVYSDELRVYNIEYYIFHGFKIVYCPVSRQSPSCALNGFNY